MCGDEETGDRRQEAGGRRQEAGDGETRDTRRGEGVKGDARRETRDGV